MSKALMRVEQIAPLVGGDMAKAEKVVRVATNALKAMGGKVDIAKVDGESAWLAVSEIVALGLSFGSRGAYLVPYWSKDKRSFQVQVIVAPQGLIQLMYRHPLVKAVQARVVREGEPFEIAYAPEPTVRHSPRLEGEAGIVRGAYAIIELTTGGRIVEWMSLAEIHKVRATSQSYSKGYGPWKDWFEEMCRKTVLKRGGKYAPQSEDMLRAMELDDMDHDFRQPVSEPSPAQAPVSAAGVAGLKSALLGAGAAQPVVAEVVDAEAVPVEVSEAAEAPEATASASVDDDPGPWGDA